MRENFCKCGHHNTMHSFAADECRVTKCKCEKYKPASELEALRAEVASLRAEVTELREVAQEHREMCEAVGRDTVDGRALDDIVDLVAERDAARFELEQTQNLFHSTVQEITTNNAWSEARLTRERDAARAEAARYRAALEGFVTRAHEHKTPDCCKHDGYSLGYRDGINEAALVARAALAPHDKGTTNNG